MRTAMSSSTTSPARDIDTRAKGSDADGRTIPFQVACDKCRTGKKKCNRMLPCGTCENSGAECVYTATEKKRPVPKEHVIALELSLEARNTQIEALDRQVQDLQGQLGAFKVQLSLWEQFVGDVARAGPSQRDVMLASFHGEDTASEHVASPAPTLIKSEPVSTPPPMSQIPQHHSPGAWPRSNGQMRVRGAGLSLFYGPTSFQITGAVEPQNTHRTRRNNSTIAEGDSLHCLLAPQSETCRRLMSLFFLRLYPYHMHFYREFFLRDLESGGPYYSDLLMYAICSVAALVSKDATMRQFSEVFAQRAQELLYNGGMDSPDITVLQGLLLLSQREIGQGNGSKGWLFAGMAFRLAHDMGLHLDPDNWEESEESDIEREIRRRCYWGAFVSDKWISLHFGRPPALSPRESDVRETKRIQYPDCWPSSILDPSLLNDQFSGKKTPQDEDGAALVGTLLCNIDLCRIVHRMLTNVFEIRDQKMDQAALAATVTEIHLELTRWLSNLPKKVHWNEWSGEVEPYTLVLHMMYHTVLIVLHRPPLSLHLTRTATITPDFDICWASVTALIKLIKQYARGNEYIYLPVTFIHTATAAASIILLKRHIVHESNDDEPAKYLNVILESLDGCSATWGAAAQAKQAILMADEEARRKLGHRVAENTNGGHNRSVDEMGLEFEQFFDLDFDMTMGGMGMGVGGVAGFLDPEWWDGVPEVLMMD